MGSSYVQEFSTTDSIQKAIQRIRGQGNTASTDVLQSGAISEKTTLANTRITLLVSAGVVSWYNAKSKVSKFILYLVMFSRGESF